MFLCGVLVIEFYSVCEAGANYYITLHIDVEPLWTVGLEQTSILLGIGLRLGILRSPSEPLVTHLPYLAEN